MSVALGTASISAGQQVISGAAHQTCLKARILGVVEGRRVDMRHAVETPWRFDLSDLAVLNRPLLG